MIGLVVHIYYIIRTSTSNILFVSILYDYTCKILRKYLLNNIMGWKGIGYRTAKQKVQRVISVGIQCLAGWHGLAGTKGVFP